MINTNRLFIRELSTDDWQDMQKIAIDFLKSEYVIYDMPIPVEDEKIKELTKQFSESHLFFAVMLEEVMIGYVCFHEDNENYDLGYCFHSDHHGRGYAYEACSATMEHISKTRDVKVFTAGTALKNVPSCKLLKKLGFVLTLTETLSFHKDKAGNDIVFEGGIYRNETRKSE